MMLNEWWTKTKLKDELKGELKDGLKDELKTNKKRLRVLRAINWDNLDENQLIVDLSNWLIQPQIDSQK